MSERDQQGHSAGGQSQTSPVAKIEDIPSPKTNRLVTLGASILKNEAQLMADFIVDAVQFDDMQVEAKQTAIERYEQFLQVKVQIQDLIDQVDITSLEPAQQNIIKMFKQDVTQAKIVLDTIALKDSKEDQWQVLSEYFSDYEAIGHILQHSADLADIVERIAALPLHQPKQPQIAEVKSAGQNTKQKPDETLQVSAGCAEWVLSVAKSNPWFQHIVDFGVEGETLSRATRVPKPLVINNVNNVLRAAEHSGHFPELAGNLHRSKKLIALRAVLTKVLTVQEGPTDPVPTLSIPALPVKVAPPQKPADTVGNIATEEIKSARQPAIVITKGQISDEVAQQFILMPENKCRVGINDDFFEGKEDIGMSLHELSCALAVMNGLPLENAMMKNEVHITPAAFLESVAQFFGVDLSTYVEASVKNDLGILVGIGLRVRIFGTSHGNAKAIVDSLRSEFNKTDGKPDSRFTSSFLGSAPKRKRSEGEEKSPRKVNLRTIWDPELREEMLRQRTERNGPY